MEQHPREVENIGAQVLSGMQRERLLGYVITVNCAVLGSVVGGLIWGEITDPLLIWPLCGIAATAMLTNGLLLAISHSRAS